MTIICKTCCISMRSKIRKDGGNVSIRIKGVSKIYMIGTEFVGFYKVPIFIIERAIVKNLIKIHKISVNSYFISVVTIRNADHRYLSSLRNEKTPSFKVNRKINRWYDYGLGNGGNIIDFGALYYRCSLADFLQKFDTDFSFHQPVVYSSDQLEQEHKITILENLSMRSFALLKYIEQRKIPLAIAGEFCREVPYAS
jgi:hypothetical protein